MNQIQYIADGFNENHERVILWRVGNYRYSMEIAGKDTEFEAEYYEALEKFNLLVVCSELA